MGGEDNVPEGAGPSGSGTSGSQPEPQAAAPEGPLNWDGLRQLIITKKIDFAMWITRLLTLVFTVAFLFPIFGSPVSYYYKAILGGAATSALRLHQRLPNVSFTRAFLAMLLLEDSCHYLFYSLIFVYCTPATLALVPIAGFALLHFASFSLSMLDALGRHSAWLGRLLISLIEYQSTTILRVIAGAEIFTMLFALIYPFMGRASLVTPFLYYRFLTLRYASRRNQYTRQMFYEFRMHAEHFANHPKAPAFISKACRNGISLISRLAPPIPAAS